MTITVNDDGSITKDGVRYFPVAERARVNQADLAEEFAKTCDADPKLVCLKNHPHGGSVFTIDKDANGAFAVDAVRRTLRHYGRELVRLATEMVWERPSAKAGIPPTSDDLATAILSQIKDTTP